MVKTVFKKQSLDLSIALITFHFHIIQNLIRFEVWIQVMITKHKFYTDNKKN